MSGKINNFTDVNKEIEELFRKEKEEYEIKKKEFYDNPIHWSNNKRKSHGLPVLRGKVNKYRNKKFHCFRPTQKAFSIIEDVINNMLKDSLVIFDEFVQVENINIGDTNKFYLS